uniref:putative Ig domain-containing protein n=1 Tax=Cellvibrio fontiphilus TaxID=1815559 RepID=UPI002B4BD833|nr:putative Ig domain-containing protein [Cellvibrio fontiphilus]
MSKLLRPKRPLIETLEPRLLFSATADIAVFDDGSSDAVQLSNAADQLDLTEVYSVTSEPPAEVTAVSSAPDILVVVDTAVRDYEMLVDDIRQQYPGNNLQIIYLDATSDGLNQITQQLTQFSELDSLHIISHGANGAIALGSTLLSANNLFTYEEELLAWRSAFSESADILLYGCDVSATQEGQAFVARIAELTGADVAASDDATGHRSLNGDWDLEFAVGDIESSALVSAAAQESWVDTLASNHYINIQGGTIAQTVSSTIGVGQSFLVDNAGATYLVNQISLQMRLESGAANQDITIQLLDGGWNDATPLASQTFNSSQLDSSFGWQTVNFGDVTLNQGQTYIIKVTTNNADGKVSVAYRSDAWNNAEMIVNGTGNSANDLNILVSYNNGSNQAPVNTVPGAQTTNQNTPLIFSNLYSNRIQVADADAFPNDIEVTLTAGQGSFSLAQTTGLTFISGDGSSDFHMVFRGSVSEVNAALATITYTPVTNYTGGDTFSITTKDLGLGGGLQDTDNISITINNVNDAPTVSITETNYAVDEQALLNLHATGIVVNDSDGDTLSVTISAPLLYSEITAVVGTTGVIISSGNGSNSLVLTGTSTQLNNLFSGNSGGTLTYRANSDTPAASETLTISASDGSLSANDTATINITAVNDAPVNTVPGVQVVNEDSSLVFSVANGNQIQIADVDAAAGSLEVILTITNGTLSLAQTTGLTFNTGDGTNDTTLVFSGSIANINAALATITYIPTANYSGPALLTLTTNDQGNTGSGAALQDVDTVDITVTAVNDAPTLDNPISDQNATEETSFNFTFAANTFSDPDGNALTYSATLSNGNPLPAWLSFNAATRTFSGLPDDADVGTISIKVTASDGNGASAEDTFDLTVAPVNDNPFVNVAVPNQNATEDAAFTFTFAANTFGDGDVGATFTYSAELASGGALPAWLNFDSATRTFSGTPTNSDVGTLSVRLIVDDGAGGTASDTFDIVVANTNDAPVVNVGIPDQTATENTLFNYTFPINAFSDPDVGDTLTYTATLADGSGLPAWLSFDSATRTFSGTPSNGDVGTINVRVTADDGDVTVNDTFNLVIQNVGSSNLVYETSGPAGNTQVITMSTPFFQSFYHDSVGATYTIDSIVLQLVKDPAASAQTITVTLLSGAYNGVVIDTASISSADISTTLGWKAFDFTNTALSDNQVYFIKIESSSNDGLVSAAIHNTDVYSNGSFHSSTGVSDVNRDVAFQVSSGINSDPVLQNPIPNQTANEDAAFNFQFAANTFNDADVGDTLTYTATMADGSALPAWLSFNAATRTFSGTPTNSDVGTISIKVTADDGNGGTPSSDTFDLVINNTNDAPSVANSIPNQSATEDLAFNFTFAANTFADADAGATLTYAAQLNGGGPLPAWLSFDSATRTFSGTPTNNDVGILSIDVIADDGNGGTVTDSFTITVANTNDAPTVANAIADQNATEDSAFNFQFAANTFADADAGATLTYAAQLNGGGPLPAWLSFDPATRTFSGTPTNNDVGILSIDVIADDGNGGTVTDTFTITVANTNDAPTVANAIADQNATEDSAFNFQFAANTFADADAGATLTYAAQLNGGGPLPAWLSFDSATRTFSGTPTNADVGTLSIDVIADDGNGGTATNTFTITVANTNDAPTVANAIADQNATEDSAFNFQFAANTFADADAGATLTYSAQLNGGGPLPAWLSFDSATRTFSGTPTNADVGTLSIDVIADDGNGGTATNTFTITVANTNDAPTVANAIADQNATEDSAFNFQFAANTFADADAGATLTYAAQLNGGGPLPAWLSFDSATRTFSGTPTNNDVGILSIDVIADDGNGGTVTDTFTITVANTNDAPTVANAIADQNATEDSAFNFQFAANTFADADAGATLTYAAQLNGGGPLPAWLSFDSATRTFSGTPTNADVGTLSIDVIADDGNGGAVTDTFTITVANTNDAPTVANAIADQNATEDSAFNFQFAANTFADADAGATLTYAAQLNGGGPLPAWLSFDSATRTFSGTPSNADVGVISIDVIASDGNGGTVTDTFTITVNNLNNAPTVANAIADQNATEDSVFNFQFAANTFADADAGVTLTYAAQLNGGGPLPAWLSFDSATRTFSGTPTNNDVGILSIDVIADDGNGGTVTDTFTITVANTNDAPTVANAIADQNATEDSAFNFQFAANTFVDADAGATLTYSAQLNGGGPLPAWLSFDSATRTFSGTPTNSDVGILSIDVIADDGNGGTVTDTFTITVANTNDAPTVANAIADQNATEDSAFNFQFAANTFADADAGATLTYAAQLNGGGPLPAWLSFDSATRTFSGTPTNNDVGILSIDVIADDGNGGTVTDTFTITVANTNDAPTVANAIADQNATENSAFNFQFAANTFADADAGATLTYAAQLNGGGPLPAWLSFDSATRTFSGTPSNADVGVVSIDVIASDGNGGTAIVTFNVTVTDVNHAPTAMPIEDRVLLVGSAPHQIDLHNKFWDREDGNSLRYEVMANSNPNAIVKVEINPDSGVMSLLVSSQNAGDSIIRLRAVDSNGAWVETSFKVKVIAEDNPVSPPVTTPTDPEGGTPTRPDPVIPPTIPPVVTVPDIPGPGVVPPVNSGDDTVGSPTPDETIAPIISPDQPLFLDGGGTTNYDPVSDKSARDYERAEELLNRNALPVSTLTASPALVNLIMPDAGFAPWEAAEFDSEVRRIRAQMDDALEEEQDRRALIAGISFSLTTGLLIWSLRAGSLLLAMVSMLPLWRGLDPLPILEQVNKRKKELEQQRKDRKNEDKSAKEVGYLFDHVQQKNKDV